MKFVYLAFLAIILVVCLAFATDFDEFDGYEEPDHDESVHDIEGEEDSGLSSSFLGQAASGLFSMPKEEMVSHFKDIIRGFSDNGFKDCDLNKDDYLDELEIECFIIEKMGFSIKTKADYVVHHYDRDQNNKLDRDEIWMIVEDKDPAIFKILPSTLEKNMLLMHGMQEDHISTGDSDTEFSDDGLEIRR